MHGIMEYDSDDDADDAARASPSHGSPLETTYHSDATHPSDSDTEAEADQKEQERLMAQRNAAIEKRRLFHSFSRFIACFIASNSIICSMHVFDLLVCCILILCALTNVLKLIACRFDAYSERESIFSGCLAPVQFQYSVFFCSRLLFDSCLMCFNRWY